MNATNFVAKMPVQLSAKFRHMSLRVSGSPAIVSPFIHNIRALCQNEQTDSIRDSSILVFNPIVKTESPGWSTFKFAVFEFRYFRHSDVCQTVRQWLTVQKMPKSRPTLFSWTTLRKHGVYKKQQGFSDLGYFLALQTPPAHSSHQVWARRATATGTGLRWARSALNLRSSHRRCR